MYFSFFIREMSDDRFSVEALVNEAREMFRQCERYRAYRASSVIECSDEYLARLMSETMAIRDARPDPNTIVMLCYNKSTKEIRRVTLNDPFELDSEWICNTIG
jgi:hypothetical protein